MLTSSLSFTHNTFSTSSVIATTNMSHYFDDFLFGELDDAMIDDFVSGIAKKFTGSDYHLDKQGVGSNGMHISLFLLLHKFKKARTD